MKYRITWEQDIDNAKNPLEAVKMALEEIKNEDSLMFTCEELFTGKQYSVDLLEEEGNEVLEIE